MCSLGFLQLLSQLNLLIRALVGFQCDLRYQALMIEMMGSIIDLVQVLILCFEFRHLEHFRSALTSY